MNYRPKCKSNSLKILEDNTGENFSDLDYNKLKNSERDGHTRPPDLPLEKSVCRSGATVRTGHGTTDWFRIG